MSILDIAADDSDVTINEVELASISDTQLEKLRMSRADLYRCFAQGLDLMTGKNPATIRPVASEKLDGTWTVMLVHYSEFSRPQPEPRQLH